MSYPTSPGPSSITISSTHPTLMSVTHSLRRQVRSRGGQRWAFALSYAALTRAQIAPLFAHRQAQAGRYGTFTFAPPIYGSTSGTATGTAAVNNAGGYSAGDSTITIDGITGTLKAGDFIKFNGHDKAYMLTADGTTSLAIKPALNAAVADNETVIYADVPFTVHYGSDSGAFDVSGVGYSSGYSVELIEAL